MTFSLLSSANPKALKSRSWGYMTYVLHLAPSDVSGYNVCPKATSGCKASCLNTAGRGGMFKPGMNTNVVQEARKRKTRLFFQDRASFMEDLCCDIDRAISQSQKLGLVPAFRLNATSDISWEKYRVPGARNIFELFPTVTFYDYTKVLGRKVGHIPNYHLTFSASERYSDIVKAISLGMNVAIVMDWMPTGPFLGLNVIDGDEHDLRFLDPIGSLIRLKPKARAKKDKTGFVFRNDFSKHLLTTSDFFAIIK